MANLVEQAIWEENLFQIETNTPWVGGSEGTANMQSKALANRTRWLKQFADETEAARGGKASLAERLDVYDNLDPASIDAIGDMATEAEAAAESAVAEMEKTITQRFQSGVALIPNRGIITGCTISKSANAIRNLSLAAGSLFLNGVTLSCPAMTNSAIVASNTSAEEQLCYGYLYIDSNNTVRFSVSEFAADVPDGGIPICRITVPAGNDQVSDQYLSLVTVTDVRRIEAGYPVQVNSAASVSVPLPSSRRLIIEKKRVS